MSTRWVYQPTEGGAIEMCEHEYHRWNVRVLSATEMRAKAFANWCCSAGLLDGEYWCEEYERQNAEIGKAIKERDWWWERAKAYGVLPF